MKWHPNIWNANSETRSSRWTRRISSSETTRMKWGTQRFRVSLRSLPIKSWRRRINKFTEQQAPHPINRDFRIRQKVWVITRDRSIAPSNSRLIIWRLLSRRLWNHRQFITNKVNTYPSSRRQAVASPRRSPPRPRCVTQFHLTRKARPMWQI